MSDSIFTKIIKREIPASIVYEDDKVIAFNDIHPSAPVHILVVPKKPIVNLMDAAPEDAPLLGYLLEAAARIARDAGIGESGFRLIINNGKDGGQTVDHLHVHILGGKTLPITF
ncbi:MAG: histidine triad nucleotide-binding protein [Capsulimonas sp.]|uniref:histidine triad nucleotide-binding protein n=1 Tax=Capsulimonas sp. TaxID=2494211 RepID=UPI0032631AC3